MEMHPLFSEWYGLAYPNPSDEILRRRWAVIESVADSLNVSQIGDLVALCVCDSKEENVIRLLNDKFKADDDSFNIRSNTLALRTLGTGILARIIGDERSQYGTYASLAVHCASFGKPNGDAFTVDIIEIAGKFLAKKAMEVRLRTSIEPSLMKLKDPEGSDPGAQVLSLAKALQKNIQAVVKKFSADFDLLAEESNMFWWLAGECSRKLGKPLSELPHPARLLLAARELADLTILRPGPPSAKAILSRAAKLGKEKSKGTSSLKQTVNSIPDEWLSSALNSVRRGSDLLTPIMSAIQKRIEIGNKAAWSSAFSTRTRISTGEQMSVHDLAFQYYQECLLDAEFSKLSEKKS
jgi:hypothetical protein